MDQIAGNLDTAAHALAGVRSSLHAAALDPDAFAADTAGLPGRLGQALHARWSTALTCHGEDAEDLAGRLTETADAVRATRSGYADTDDLARRRLRRGM